MTKEDRVRAAILKAAQRMFKRFGYRKTTIEDIASEAGKGKSTLYYYFKNKEEIFLAVIWLEWNMIIDEVREALKGKEMVEARLKTYIRVKIRGIANFANVYSGLRSEQLNKYSFIPEFRREAKLKETQLIVELIKTSKNKEQLRFQNDDELELIAFSMVNILVGIQETIIQQDDPKNYERPRLLNMVASMLLNGICKS